MKRCRIIWLVALACIVGAPVIVSAGEGDVGVDLSGEWIAEYVTTTETRLPVIGGFDTTTEAEVAVEIEQRGDQVMMTTRTCSIDMSTDLPMADTKVPDAFVDSLSEQRRRVRLRDGGDGLEFVSEKLREVLGVRLDDPGSDKLPEDDDDERVYDHDGDGNPGVTIRIDGVVSGDIYVVRNGWDRWYGLVTDEDRIDGRIIWETEQNVVGASRRILSRQPEAHPHDDPDKNYFRMRRADDGLGC